VDYLTRKGGWKMRKQIEKGVQLSVWISEDEVLRVEQIAKKARISKSRLVRNFVLIGLKDAEFLDAVGIITLMVRAEELKEAFRGMQLAST
jgi:hypothetical protein